MRVFTTFFISAMHKGYKKCVSLYVINTCYGIRVFIVSFMDVFIFTCLVLTSDKSQYWPCSADKHLGTAENEKGMGLELGYW